jgi:competence/damage-inducible protein CinA-like protein
MPAAEIITIGTEILLGEIVDTNTGSIARALRGIGLDLYRTGTVGDNAERIAQAVSEAIERAEVVITTGGLGPTIDDATREGIALAVGVELEFHPELWEQIEERFARFRVEPPENNRRQAMLPAGAFAIDNPVGTAPAFFCEHQGRVIVSLPGVPAELSHLMQSSVLPLLRKRLNLTSVIRSKLVRTAGVGESWLDEQIDDLERLSNPTVGLAAHPGQVDIRITAKARSDAEADEMIWKVEATLRQRLKDNIFGYDASTLESVALDSIEESGEELVVVEVGTGGLLNALLAEANSGVFRGGRLFPEPAPPEVAEQALDDLMQSSPAAAGLMLHLSQAGSKAEIHILVRNPSGEKKVDRSYGAALTNAPRFAVNLALDTTRRYFAS